MRLANAALALVVAACGADEISIPDHAPAPPDPAAPAPQVVIDPRAWYLAGDGLTPADPRFVARAGGPADVVDVWLDGVHVARARPDNGFDLGFDLADVAIGDHTVLVSADGADVAFAELPLHKSAALYVAVSNDWDTGDHTDDKLQRQERLHAAHPHLVLTHFVGPYTFTDPTVSAARAQQLVDWVLRFRAEKGDEIGLHIHPYCNFVTAAGVTCRTSPSFRDVTDATGYTVVLGAYTRAELDLMFAKATELFVAHGLGRPTSFRAGGWTATGDVLARSRAPATSPTPAAATGRGSRSGAPSPTRRCTSGTRSTGARSPRPRSRTTRRSTTSWSTPRPTAASSRPPTTARWSTTSPPTR